MISLLFDCNSIFCYLYSAISRSCTVAFYRNLISAGTGSYNTGTAFGSGFLCGLAVWLFVLVICLITNGEGVCGIHIGGYRFRLH
mgnify:CR=1 FL=1